MKQISDRLKFRNWETNSWLTETTYPAVVHLHYSHLKCDLAYLKPHEVSFKIGFACTDSRTLATKNYSEFCLRLPQKGFLFYW